MPLHLNNVHLFTVYIRHYVACAFFTPNANLFLRQFCNHRLMVPIVLHLVGLDTVASLFC